MIFLEVALLLSAAAQAPAPKSPSAPTPVPAAPDKVVVTVGDEKLTVADIDHVIDAMPEQLRVQARGSQKRQFLEQIVRLKLLSQEARRRKLDQTPQFQKQLALQTENLLAGLLFQDLSTQLKVDEAAARRFYDEHKSEYERVRVRHILIRVKGSSIPMSSNKNELTDPEALAKAQEVRKRLLAGEDFATVAKSESDDATTASKGGDLGLFQHGRMVPAFDKVAFSLPVGEVSEPVKTAFGYHLIKVEQKELKTFEEMRPELEKRLRPELARQAVEDLRKNTPVSIDEDYAGPAPAPAVSAFPARPPSLAAPAKPPALAPPAKAPASAPSDKAPR